MCVESIKQQWCTKWICVFHTFSDQKSVIRAEMNGSTGNINHLIFFLPRTYTKLSKRGSRNSTGNCDAPIESLFLYVRWRDARIPVQKQQRVKVIWSEIRTQGFHYALLYIFFPFWHKTKTDDFIDVTVLTGIGDETSGCSTLDHVCRFLLLPFKAYKVWL